MRVEDLTAILQLSITPVALISGVGLLLLSMTNRLARTIDISRNLDRELQQAAPENLVPIQVQIRILYNRSRYLRCAISLALTSILFASLIIFCLFAISYLQWQLNHLVMSFWGLGIICLVLSIIYFIHDITLTLRALKLNLQQHLDLGQE
ncbi:DUF2721 domain-containing protein [bacterium]|nr:DUF2721 domain-containing protein [bacterium]